MKRSTILRSFSFFRLSLIAIILVFVISYISLCKLVYIDSGIKMPDGKKMHLFAQEVRTNLTSQANAEAFTCQTKDNVTLHGIYVKRTNAQGTIVLCHGYRCCKELTAGYLDLFATYNILMFDFRGHGQNKRMVTTIGCHEHKDVAAAVGWVKQHKPDQKPVIILGVSMGGAAALKAVEHNPGLCDAVIVDSTFSNLKSLLYNTFIKWSGLPTFPFLPIMERMFNYIGACDVNLMNPLASIQKIKQPVMLIHSCIDNLVPVQESLLMYAQVADTGAKLWIAPVCKHGWLHKEYPKLYQKKITKFLQKKILI